MKKTTAFLFGISAVLLGASANLSLAAGVALTNGGLGQIANSPQQFGIAVCNGGAQALTNSVPVAVVVGDKNATIPSASSIAPKQCAYSYAPYSQFDMQPGQTYSVNVAIDPQHSVITNTDNQATYSVTVPSQEAATNGAGLTADASDQLSNPFAAVWNWFVGLFKSL
jgi:hypothetical protein